jgi:hypothetical protein
MYIFRFQDQNTYFSVLQKSMDNRLVPSKLKETDPCLNFQMFY